MSSKVEEVVTSLQRGEISASETYTQALAKFSGEPEEPEIRQMRDEHRTSANALREMVREHGGVPSQDSGWWGTWAKLTEGTAAMFGKTAALKALKEGEQRGIKAYEQALASEIPADCRTLIQTQLLPQSKQHVSRLDLLMGS
jgi:demethoxyubiquinone hydroxylase (CLK1/Coq7/Cat5 family)